VVQVWLDAHSSGMTFTSLPRKSISSSNTQGQQMERVMHKLDDTMRLTFLTEQNWHKKMDSYFTAVNVWQETQNYLIRGLTSSFVHATHSAGKFKHTINNIN
jgi:hypothetical protein